MKLNFLKKNKIKVLSTSKTQLVSMKSNGEAPRRICGTLYIVPTVLRSYIPTFRGWSGGAKVLGKLPVPGRPTILITVGQGPSALAVGAGGGCLDIFTLIYPFSSLYPSLWETARYRLKYCLKGPLNPKQPTTIPHFPQNPTVPH